VRRKLRELQQPAIRSERQLLEWDLHVHVRPELGELQRQRGRRLPVPRLE
jgi:hypothetical protein